MLKKQIKHLILVVFTMMVLFMMSVSASAAFSVTKSGVNYPKSYATGSTFSIKGTLKGNVVLKTVVTGIYNSTGKTALQKYTASPNAISYNMQDADSHLQFDKLAPGTYYYRATVTNVNNVKLRVFDYKFTVTTAPKMTIKKTNVILPSALKEGKGFTMSGKITSNLTMKSIVFTIYNSTGQSCLQRYTATVNGKSYSVSKAAPYLNFKKLKQGNYYYRISVYDSKGKKIRIVNKQFKVGPAATTPTTPTTTSSIKISNPKPASSIAMSEGTSYGLGGKITSTYKLSSITAQILDANKNVKLSKKVTTSATSYEIAGSPIDAAMTFNTLKPGMYTYVLSAIDVKSKKAVLINRIFFIQSRNSKITIQAPVPSADVTIAKGKYYPISGLISVPSGRTIKSVQGILLNSSGKEVFNKTVAPGTRQYQLGGGDIDKAMTFNTLSAGTYYLNIFVKDDLGSVAPVISKKIVIK